MSGTRISAALRSQIAERAAGRCEYCGVHEDDVLFPHEVDHIIAEQHGGGTTPENLALSCFHCNRHKGPNLAAVDRQTGRTVKLFHPRRQRWNDHFRAEGARIVPLTGNGRATAVLLRFNDADRLRVRESLVRARRFPPKPEDAV